MAPILRKRAAKGSVDRRPSGCSSSPAITASTTAAKTADVVKTGRVVKSAKTTRPVAHAKQRKGIRDITPGENLIMKLPPELRNEIYALVTGDGEPASSGLYGEPYQNHGWKTIPGKNGSGAILIGEGSGSRRTQTRAKGKSKLLKATYGDRQPGLLRASKQIRHEASEIYYGTHDFVLEIHESWLRSAAEWLKRYAKICDADTMFKRVKLKTSISRLEEPFVWFVLTKLIIDVSANLGRQVDECDRWAEFLSEVQVPSPRLVPAVIKRAVRASRTHTPFEALHTILLDQACAELKPSTAKGQADIWMELNRAMKRLSPDMVPRVLRLGDFDLVPHTKDIKKP